jgi:hypothetical protein
MKMRILVAMVIAMLLGSNVSAQQPQPVPQPAPAPARPPEPLPPGTDQPNIRFDIAIADEGGGITPVQKAVTLTVQGSGSGSLRSSGSARLMGSAPDSRDGTPVSVELNVDVKLARYNVKEPDKIRARVALDYQPFSREWKTAPGRVRASVDVMLDNGKETALWQTTDPVMGVRTTIKVTATVLK